jgi:hypothetical protein
MVDHLNEATRGLFEGYGFAVAPASREVAAATESEGMAVIGYAGEGVRGALVVITTEAAVGAWMNAAGVPDGEVEDTLGEFSNMLLGRLKCELMPFGISILATTPTVATGTGLRLSKPPGPSKWCAFDGPGWSLRVRLDASFDPGFEPRARPLPLRAPRAGDAIDFDLAVEGADA